MISNDKIELAPAFGVTPVELNMVGVSAMSQAPTVLIPKALQHVHAPLLVQSWWNRLLAVIREPVSIHQLDGQRVVQVVGTACVLIKTDGAISGRLWVRDGDRMIWSDMDDNGLILSNMPTGYVWLHCIAVACLIEAESYWADKNVTLKPADLEQYVLMVFGRFKLELKRHCDLRVMRRKVAQALDLNRDAVRLARRMIPRLMEKGSLPANDLRPLEYNLALAHMDKLLKLERELPVILPLYVALLGDESVTQDPEPIRAVRVYLLAHGVAPKTWRLLAKASTRFFWPVRHFYRGNPAEAMTDYLKVVQALELAQAPDNTLMWHILSRYGHPAMRRIALLPGFEKVFNRLAPGANAYMALPDRHAQRGLLEPILEWLAMVHRIDLTKPQRKAGWPWLVQQAQGWQERRSLELQSQKIQWPVPFVDCQMGSYCIQPLRTPFELWQESRAMRHCADTFTGECIQGQSLIVSLRHRSQPDKRVATARYSRQIDGWKQEQVRGFANRDPEPKVSQAVARLARWLNSLRHTEPDGLEAGGVWEPEETTKLRELFVEANLQAVLDRDSTQNQLATRALVDALAQYKNQFWWVYRASGPKEYMSSIVTTGELMLLASKGVPLELKGGPFLTREEARACREAERQDRKP